MKIYITFGQEHKHTINNISLDKDIIASIEAPTYSKGRDIAFELFGTKFATSYENIDDILQYFPRGIIEVN